MGIQFPPIAFLYLLYLFIYVLFFFLFIHIFAQWYKALLNLNLNLNCERHKALRISLMAIYAVFNTNFLANLSFG